MPSFTFVSTANAFVLRGAVPVFVDIRPDTLNLDETLIERAITKKTRAIVPIHYAGVACALDPILEIAKKHGLLVIEDAAQAIMATYKGKFLGTLGAFGALSFHETKNVTCGEGGALLINDERFVERAAVVREKGTNRDAFLRGKIDKYTWTDIGSSYLPSEITAAFLYPQLLAVETTQTVRLRQWLRYHAAFAELEAREYCRRPTVPSGCGHNAHTYFLLFESLAIRNCVMEKLKHAGVAAAFHYVPLHGSPGGKRWARCATSMTETNRAADAILRLPLWNSMSDQAADLIIDRVIEAVTSAIASS